MNVFGIGTGELLLILVIVLLVMGPERIPQLARQWGKFVRVLSRFTRTWQEVSAEINRQINLEEMVNAPAKPKPVPPTPALDPEENANTIAPPTMQPSPGTAAPDAAVVGATPAAAEEVPAESVISSGGTPAGDATPPVEQTERPHE